MKHVALSLTISLVATLAGCGGAPKPAGKPSGPPPEYEPPRGVTGGPSTSAVAPIAPPPAP